MEASKANTATTAIIALQISLDVQIDLWRIEIKVTTGLHFTMRVHDGADDHTSKRAQSKIKLRSPLLPAGLNTPSSIFSLKLSSFESHAGRIAHWSPCGSFQSTHYALTIYAKSVR
jgi:hypothetical protein